MAKKPDTQEQASDHAATNLSSLVARIDEIVVQMESRDMQLEKSVSLFEEGIALTRQAQGLLETAQQRVTMLIDAGSSTGE